MNEKEILKNLVKFNTINDKSNEEIISYIENILVNKGFNVDYNSKCLVMSIKDTYKLGFLGHTDTVEAGSDWTFNPFEMKENSSKLYGLGICDMKGGIAAFIQAVLETKWEELKYGVKLYFTYDEEINFGGIKELVKNNEKFPNNMIIGEPTDNLIMNGSKGLLEIKLIFDGISAHSSMPNEGKNAIENGIEFLNDLRIFYNQLKEDKNDNFEIGYTTMNIGKINGGKSINIVPNRCEVLIDFRVIKDEHISLILNKINELTIKYGSSYVIINNVKPFINESEQICATNYITEASFINAKNRYILGVGPNNAHKANEYIFTESLKKLVVQYKEMIYKFCKE